MSAQPNYHYKIDGSYDLNTKVVKRLAMLVFVYLVLLAGIATSTPKEDHENESLKKLFNEFVETYKRDYGNLVEFDRRFLIFVENMKEIGKLNNRSKHAWFGITEHTDMTLLEFIQWRTGLQGSSPQRECAIVKGDSLNFEDAPEDLDWRHQNVVTPVKNQGRCGSCWAFSSIANIESQYALKYGEMEEFSEQQLLDCDRRSYGCQGGWMTNAMSTLIEQGGLETSQDYPYKGRRSLWCKYDSKKSKTKVTACNAYDLSDEDQLKHVLHMTGPLSIAMYASPIQNYKGGILDENECPQETVNHAVTLVGYGSEDGVDYWLIKNSWGDDWGEDGYFRLSRGNSTHTCNTCNIMAEWMVSAIINDDVDND